MNVLNESFYASPHLALPHSISLLFLTCNFITGQSFMKYSDKRPVPG